VPGHRLSRDAHHYHRDFHDAEIMVYRVLIVESQFDGLPGSDFNGTRLVLEAAGIQNDFGRTCGRRRARTGCKHKGGERQ
jgi:hypothetical protein